MLNLIFNNFHARQNGKQVLFLIWQYSI